MTETAAPTAAAPAPRAPGFVQASLRIMDLSIGQMLWSRRTIFMALVVLGPVIIALVVRLITSLGVPTRINGQAMGGPAIFGLIIWIFYLRFTVPVLGVFYGTALIADEVDDRTITYLFTRPIPRGAVLVGKYLAYMVATGFVVLPSVVLVYLLIVPINGSLGASFLDFVKDLALLAVGLAVYGALFAFIGAWFKRPLLIGLIFVFGWEPGGAGLPGLPEALHRRLLPAGARAPRHAAGQPAQPRAGHRARDARARQRRVLAGGHLARHPVPGWPHGRAPGVRPRTIGLTTEILTYQSVRLWDHRPDLGTFLRSDRYNPLEVRLL